MNRPIASNRNTTPSALAPMARALPGELRGQVLGRAVLACELLLELVDRHVRAEVVVAEVGRVLRVLRRLVDEL